jgi:hypothetical protein
MSLLLRVFPVVSRAISVDCKAAPLGGRVIPISDRSVPVNVTAFRAAGRADPAHIRAVDLAKGAVPEDAVEGRAIFIVD